jgi:hypothetical protein
VPPAALACIFEQTAAAKPAGLNVLKGTLEIQKGTDRGAHDLLDFAR